MIKALLTLIGVKIGDFNSALWFAVNPRPLTENEISFLMSAGRGYEVALIGNNKYWVMGRVTNPSYNNPYSLSDILVREESNMEPDLASFNEYRFKIVRS